MKKYKVTVEEVISEDFEIIAENCEQARDIAIEKYNLSADVPRITRRRVPFQNFSESFNLPLKL